MADAHHFWGIGDFSLTDSPIDDYDEFFTEPYSSTKFGQINAYDVTVSGWDAVHFDAFDHTINNADKEVFRHSAYSHDGTGGVIPEPGTLALLGIGLAGLGARLRRKV